MVEGEDNIFAAAALSLEMSRRDRPGDATDAAQLIETLGYDPIACHDAALHQHRINLLRIAGRFTRFFRLKSRSAPGLYFTGAQIAFDRAEGGGAKARPINFAGAGCEFSNAFEACAGEASEYLSQIESGPAFAGTPWAVSGRERPTASTSEHFAARLGITVAELAGAGWLPAASLAGTVQSFVPAALCLRTEVMNRQQRPLVALSEGVAAGVTLAGATQRALLEVIERDAAALWWIGGRPAKHFEPAQLEQSGVATFLQDVRHGDQIRSVHILDITSDLDVPCIAAWSMRADGRNFACGLAARARAEDAMRAALIEMSAMELNFELQPDPAPGSFRQGPTTLGEASRHEDIRPYLARTLVGHERSSLPLDLVSCRGSSEIDMLARRLDAAGLDAWAVDLTQAHLGIPVAKVLVPRLQPLTPHVTTPRLMEVLDDRGGGDLQRRGWSLMPT